MPGSNAPVKLWFVTATERRSFWWDVGLPADAAVDPLRAVVFDLDGAVADIERDGHRVAFNAAFAANGLNIVWTVEDYGRLVCIGDERRLISTALRRLGVGRANAEIAARVHRSKTELFDDCVLNGDVTPRAGVQDLVSGLFVAGVPVAVVSTGYRSVVDPLVRQLIGDGVVETVVALDDLPNPGPQTDVYGHALWELGIGPESALAIVGSFRGFRAAVAAKLATVVVTTGYSAGEDYHGAADVRASYDGLSTSGCERLHRRWWTAGR